MSGQKKEYKEEHADAVGEDEQIDEAGKQLGKASKNKIDGTNLKKAVEKAENKGGKKVNKENR